MADPLFQVELIDGRYCCAACREKGAAAVQPAGVPDAVLTCGWEIRGVVLNVVSGTEGKRIQMSAEQAILLGSQMLECGYLARWARTVMGSGVAAPLGTLPGPGSSARN